MGHQILPSNLCGFTDWGPTVRAHFRPNGNDFIRPEYHLGLLSGGIPGWPRSMVSFRGDLSSGSSCWRLTSRTSSRLTVRNRDVLARAFRLGQFIKPLFWHRHRGEACRASSASNGATLLCPQRSSHIVLFFGFRSLFAVIVVTFVQVAEYTLRLHYNNEGQD